MTQASVMTAVLVQEERSYRLDDLRRETGLDPHAFVELVSCEILAVLEQGSQTYLVSEAMLYKSRRAARLARDFELSPQGIALAMRLIERIDELEATLAQRPGVLHE